MKRILTCIILSLITCFYSYAQVCDNANIPTHSLNVQVADGLVPDTFAAVVVSMGVAFAAPWVAVAGGDANDITLNLEGLTPFVSADYDYHFPDTRWSVGGELGAWHCALTSDESKQHFHFGTATASGKFFYKPYGVCKLYGGANLGVGVLFNSEEASPLPIVQLTPIGMRLGNEAIAFMAEMGVGYKGFLQIGVNVGL